MVGELRRFTRNEEHMTFFPNYKQSIYTINKRKGKYYFIRSRTPIKRTHYAYKFMKIFSNHSRRSAIRKCKFIKGNIPGVYGIFLKETGANNKNLGKCLYIGQSVNLARRKKEHLKLIQTAKMQLRKNSYQDLDRKYYAMANYLNKGKKLLFANIISFDKKYWSKLNFEESQDLLCMAEQYAIDTFKPSLNVLAVRKTERNNFNN